MPELPEVETVRRGLAPLLEGARIDKVVLNRGDLRFPFPAGFAQALDGATIEQAGLVTTQKVGRVRTCRLGRSRLEQEMAWIEDYRKLWDARFGALDQIVEELKEEEARDGRKH